MDFKKISTVFVLWGAGVQAANSSLDLASQVAQVSSSVVNIQSLVLKNKNSPKPQVGDQSLGTGFLALRLIAKDETPPNPEFELFLVLTNAHVVAGADLIGIQILGDKRLFKAKLAGQDTLNDIAALKTWLPKNLKPLNLKTSKSLRVGEGVFAIGNPFGLGHTVTSGILSAKDRSIGVGRTDRYLQTDAAVNFGNSGGPLFNLKGEVIGMNTLVKDDGRGIGFAIPADTLLKVIPILQEGQNYSKPWIGIALNPAPNFLNIEWNETGISTEGPTGLLISEIFEPSPASKIGLKAGDRILEFKDSKGVLSNLSSPYEIRDRVEGLSLGEEIELKIQRGSKTLLARIKTETLPQEKKSYEFD